MALHNWGMVLSSVLSKVLTAVATETDCQKALLAISDAALQSTNSRHALIAVLNEDLARLEIRAGSGSEFGAHLIREQLPLDVGRQDGIVSFVAATGTSVMTGNVREEPHYKNLFPNTESEMAVPVRNREDRVIAVLNVESNTRDAYGQDDENAITSLAALVGLVLEREEQARREEALIQVGTALDTALSEEALIDRVIQVAEDVLRLQALSIFIRDERSGSFVLRGTIGGGKENIGRVKYEPGEGFTGWVCQEGTPIMLDDPHTDARWRGKFVEFPSDQIASFIAVPIVSRGKSVGAIRALRRKSDNQYLDNRFTEHDQRILQTIAEQMAVGLENMRSLERLLRSERMIAWGELSAKSSHMIGNRVFALKGDVNELGHLVAEGNLDPKEIASIQSSLSTNVTRVEEILQDFRDFLTATQVQRMPTDLNQILRETVAEVFPRRTNVELRLDLAEHLPPILVDAKKIRRAFSELIENALNYVESGQLCITSQWAEDREHRRSTRQVEVIVEDSGPGVEADQKSTIFQPFYSQRVKGMGLGLSIVKGIVDAHGGDVFEAGREGTGAKFVLRLPVAD